MPIYEYVCDKCKNKFELMRPFSRSHEPASCPRCEARAERVLSRCHSFSTNSYGVTSEVGGSSGGCSSCSGGSCSSCGTGN